jgi:putative SOS response-associated peptidase YedK
MCKRFTQMYTWEQLSFLYQLRNPLAPNIRPNWNAAPTQNIGVIVPEDGGRIYKTMRWGLVPPWSKDLKIGNQALNARFDTAATKPMFRSAWKSRRCLIPASGYYEWREIEVPRQKKPLRQPFYVTRKDGELLTFAGLWERWGPDDDKFLTFTILTADASDGIRDLHHRMPVMLAKGGFGPWLSSSALAVDPDIGTAVTITPVSTKVNSSKYNEADCIEPLTV